MGVARLQLRNYLEELGPTRNKTIYEKSRSISRSKDAFRKMRAFLMKTKGLSEDEAVFPDIDRGRFRRHAGGDGNWGIHASSREPVCGGDV